jgi:hypothetical protein
VDVGWKFLMGIVGSGGMFLVVLMSGLESGLLIKGKRFPL